jgi:hypothetical protein
MISTCWDESKNRDVFTAKKGKKSAPKKGPKKPKGR